MGVSCGDVHGAVTPSHRFDTIMSRHAWFCRDGVRCLSSRIVILCIMRVVSRLKSPVLVRHICGDLHCYFLKPRLPMNCTCRLQAREEIQIPLGQTVSAVTTNRIRIRSLRQEVLRQRYVDVKVGWLLCDGKKRSWFGYTRAERL